MSENIQFESYRQKSFIEKLVAKMPKGMQSQQKLHEIYKFISANSCKFFLYWLFDENHRMFEGENQRAGFFIHFDSDGINRLVCEIESVLKSMGREYIVIDANGKTFHQSIQSVTGKKNHPLYNPYRDLRETLLSSDKVVIFKEISKCKLRTGKYTIVRSIIKALHRAHSGDIRPLSDILFVDYADYLQKSWKDIKPFIKAAL